MIMNSKTLKHAEDECLRFLDKIRAVIPIEEEREAYEKSGTRAYVPYATRKHGAMRRAAHDLKEALTFVTQNKDLK